MIPSVVKMDSILNQIIVYIQTCFSNTRVDTERTEVGVRPGCSRHMTHSPDVDAHNCRQPPCQATTGYVMTSEV